MLPFQPPFPTIRNLPFHTVPPVAPSARGAGSHTSILMSDSAVGLSVAATRQNAGRSANGLPPPRPPGWVKAPAATVSTVVTVACGNASEARLSQVAAAAGTAPAAHAAATSVNSPVDRSCMGLPLLGQREHVQRLPGGGHANLRRNRRGHEPRTPAAKPGRHRDVLAAVGREGDGEALHR